MDYPITPLLHQLHKTHFNTNHPEKNRRGHPGRALFHCSLTHALTASLKKSSFHAKQLFDQPAFTQRTFCTNQFLQISFYTDQQILHKTSLDKPPLTQTTFYTSQLHTTLLWACRPEVQGPAECGGLLHVNDPVHTAGNVAAHPPFALRFGDQHVASGA